MGRRLTIWAGFALAVVTVGWLGAWWGWRSIPREVREPAGPIAPGTRLVVPSGGAVPSSPAQRFLRDYLFAAENGIRLQSSLDSGAVRELAPGTGLVVRGWDLDLLKVELEGGGVTWVPAGVFLGEDRR